MRVLIIEDEISLAEFVKSGLEAEHFVVDHAKNGKEGQFLSIANDYDLIIIDLYLPDKNGLEICRKLREEGKKVSILILTVEKDLSKKLEAFNLGADDYLTKPFSIEELVARARALLRRGKEMNNEILQIDDLSLDLKRHLVKRRGKEIFLRHKEYMLLEYFMRHPGRVLTRSMILEHVWDMNADPFTNTIDVHIRSLRQKVEKGFKKKLIYTVHGEGYKMIEE